MSSDNDNTSDVAINSISAGMHIYFDPTPLSDCVLSYGGVFFHVHRFPLVAGSEHCEARIGGAHEPVIVPPPPSTTVIVPPNQWTELVPQTGPRSSFGPWSRLEHRSSHNPADMLQMLSLLYSGLAYSPVIRQYPTLKRQPDGRIVTNGKVWITETAKLSLPMLQWSKDWRCRMKVNWDDLRYLERGHMAGTMYVLWLCETYGGPSTLAEKLRVKVASYVSCGDVSSRVSEFSCM